MAVPSFAGFPSGKNPSIPLPEQFFTVLLPEIEDSSELKVTLHLFWLLYHKRGSPRCASERELARDPILRRSLRQRGDPRPPEERLRDGLERAVARGTLLRVLLRVQSERVAWYFFNTERSRQAIARLRSGALAPMHLLELEGLTASNDGWPEVLLESERPNIFTLYEQNIGLLLPMLAEELKEAAERYPAPWIEEAFREAVQQNKRSWSYIRAILRRWETEGKGGKRRGTTRRYS
jgi:DNA replication protein